MFKRTFGCACCFICCQNDKRSITTADPFAHLPRT
ncbi:hypothetical protein VCHENC02_5065A, partial [Vibrio harveyi]